jgi:hypothetical protein
MLTDVQLQAMEKKLSQVLEKDVKLGHGKAIKQARGFYTYRYASEDASVIVRLHKYSDEEREGKNYPFVSGSELRCDTWAKGKMRSMHDWYRDLIYFRKRWITIEEWRTLTRESRLTRMSEA